MRFECFARYGNRWSYLGTVEAKDSRLAALRMQYVHNRNVWGIRPEGSQDKMLIYRITSAPHPTV
jgi:hypothetical protein